MFRRKRFVSATVVLAIALSQVLIAQAAPLADPLVGTIDSITQGVDAGGNDVIIVNYTDTDGIAQVRELSLLDAETLGLITLDPPNDPAGLVTLVAVAGDSIDLTPLEPPPPPDPCALPEGADSMVGEALTGFFCGGLGVDYTMLMGWHDAGNGFGVMTQALFMAQALGGDAALAEALLAAKSSRDYSTLVSDWGVPEGVSNWGQLKKWVMAGEVKSLTNLGAIMSGRAQPPVIEPVTTDTTTTVTDTTTTAPTSATDNGNGKSNGKGKNNGNGNGNGNSNGKAKGKNK
jgi:hypothetical protein